MEAWGLRGFASALSCIRPRLRRGHGRRAFPLPARCFLLKDVGRHPLAPPRVASPRVPQPGVDRPRGPAHWAGPHHPYRVRPPRPPGGGAVALGTQRLGGRPPLGAGFPAETGTPGRAQRREMPFGGRRYPSTYGSGGSQYRSCRRAGLSAGPGCRPFLSAGRGRPRRGPSLPSPGGSLRGTQVPGCGGRAVAPRAGPPAVPPLGTQTSGEGHVQSGLRPPSPPGCPRGPCRRQGRHPPREDGSSGARGPHSAGRKGRERGARGAPGPGKRGLRGRQAAAHPERFAGERSPGPGTRRRARPRPAGLLPALLVG